MPGQPDTWDGGHLNDADWWWFVGLDGMAGAVVGALVAGGLSLYVLRRTLENERQRADEAAAENRRLADEAAAANRTLAEENARESRRLAAQAAAAELASAERMQARGVAAKLQAECFILARRLLLEPSLDELGRWEAVTHVVNQAAELAARLDASWPATGTEIRNRQEAVLQALVRDNDANAATTRLAALLAVAREFLSDPDGIESRMGLPLAETLEATTSELRE